MIEMELFEAINAGNVDRVKESLKKGINVNFVFMEKTPLQFAVGEKGNKEIAEFLIDKGADVNIKTETGTALHTAVTFGKPEIVKLLIKAGANVDIDDKGKTPLDKARMFYKTSLDEERRENFEEIIKILKPWWKFW